VVATPWQCERKTACCSALGTMPLVSVPSQEASVSTVSAMCLLVITTPWQCERKTACYSALGTIALLSVPSQKASVSTVSAVCLLVVSTPWQCERKTACCSALGAMPMVSVPSQKASVSTVSAMCLLVMTTPWQCERKTACCSASGTMPLVGVPYQKACRASQLEQQLLPATSYPSTPESLWHSKAKWSKPSYACSSAHLGLRSQRTQPCMRLDGWRSGSACTPLPISAVKKSVRRGRRGIALCSDCEYPQSPFWTVL